MAKILTLNLLRITALVVASAGAVASVGLVLYAGRHNRSVILVLLFLGWVLSPFVAFLVANIAARRWAVSTCVTLYWLMIAIAIVSTAAYSGVLLTPGAKLTGIFLMVPLFSWVLIATVIPIAASRARRAARRNSTF